MQPQTHLMCLNNVMTVSCWEWLGTKLAAIVYRESAFIPAGYDYPWILLCAPINFAPRGHYAVFAKGEYISFLYGYGWEGDQSFSVW